MTCRSEREPLVMFEFWKNTILFKIQETLCFYLEQFPFPYTFDN